MSRRVVWIVCVAEASEVGGGMWVGLVCVPGVCVVVFEVDVRLGVEDVMGKSWLLSGNAVVVSLGCKVVREVEMRWLLAKGNGVCPCLSG